MAKLPNYQQAQVPQPKITSYLLAINHSDGRGKALFFTAHGFSLDNWQVLAVALCRHAADQDLAAEEASPFGMRYIIEGIISTPDGRNPHIRSIWFIETGEETPRFVTAYPLPRKEP